MTVETAHVAISGAGPNGLMLACELALAGVRPVVLDKLPAPSDEPKANGLVGQVIRQLDMRGLYHEFGGEDGPPQPAHGWMFAGLPVSFLEVDENPMYALLLAQPRLVRLLEKRARDLGVDIRWGHELTALRQGDDDVALTVAATGRAYRLDAGYLVGADGGRSAVRKSVGIDFPGSTAPVVSRLASVDLRPEFREPDGGYRVPGFGRIRPGYNRFENGSVMLFQLGRNTPLIGTVEYSATQGGVEGSITFDEVREALHRVVGADVPVDPPSGPGPHALRRLDGINSRQADRYRDGRVILLGDAAHVHSPMGGPGLNLGMQDAVNLGWKLAGVVNGWAPAGLLDTYESERYPVGERVMMSSQAQLALAAPGPDVEALRKLFGELASHPSAASHLANTLAGSDVRYDVGGDHPHCGVMVPDLVLDDGRRVVELLHDARPVLLDMSGGAASEAAAAWADGVDTVAGAMADGPAAMLIRPDGYVAWAADEFDADDAPRLRAALARWFGER
jgi:2-polyprenyl-6-methoxyphenol hydroxylase-like FAD-dependent oxidoreductase